MITLVSKFEFLLKHIENSDKKQTQLVIMYILILLNHHIDIMIPQIQYCFDYF